MGNSHEVVVYHIGKMIRGKTIAFNQNGILQFPIGKTNLSPNGIFYHCLTLEGHFESDDMGFASFQSTFNVFTVQVTTMTVIPNPTGFFPFLLFDNFRQPFRSTKAGIRLPVGDERFYLFVINIQPFRLCIGSIITAFFRPLIPIQA